MDNSLNIPVHTRTLDDKQHYLYLKRTRVDKISLNFIRNLVHFRISIKLPVLQLQFLTELTCFPFFKYPVCFYFSLINVRTFCFLIILFTCLYALVAGVFLFRHIGTYDNLSLSRIRLNLIEIGRSGTGPDPTTAKLTLRNGLLVSVVKPVQL